MLFTFIFGSLFVTFLTILNLLPLPSFEHWDTFNNALQSFFTAIPQAAMWVHWLFGDVIWFFFLIIFGLYSAMLTVYTALFLWSLIRLVWDFFKKFFP